MRTSEGGFFKVGSEDIGSEDRKDVVLMESDQSIIEWDFAWLDAIITRKVGQGKILTRIDIRGL